MNTAVATAPIPRTAAKGRKIDTEVLQDILYEILANGLDPREARVTAAQIEQFLFEHARAPKPLEAFLAFFEKCGLSTDPDEYLKGLDIKGMPLSSVCASPPPLPLSDNQWVSNDNSVAGPKAQPKSPATPLVEVAPAELRGGVPFALATRGFGSRTKWAIAGAVAVLLGAGASVGFAVANLQAQVTRANTAQRQSQQVVLELQKRLNGLQSEVARNSWSIEGLEPRIDLLTETIAPQPVDPQIGQTK